jgi:putative ABC transport system permease protein
MTRLFGERCERALDRGGPAALVGSAARSLADLLASAAADRLGSRRRPTAATDRAIRRGDSMLTTIGPDLRYAVRTLARQPMLAATVVLTLAIAIGAAVTIFAVVDAAVLAPLPYPRAKGLVSLGQQDRRFGWSPFPPPSLEDLRERVRGVGGIAGFSPSWQMTLSGAGETRTATAAFVSDGLLETLGTAPVAGRLFLPHEHAAGGPRVALVSRSFWDRQFGSAVALRDQTIRLDGEPYVIVGVLPANLRMPITTSIVSRNPSSAELWLPFAQNPYVSSRTIPVMNVIGRLEPGVGVDRANAELAGVGRALGRERGAGGDLALGAMPLDELVSRPVRTPLLLLLGAVGCLLSIACANVANLLLARGVSRRHELAVRASLGATRGRVVQQLLVESAVIATAGGLIGLLLAAWALSAAPAIVRHALPPTAELSIDARVAAAALAITLATAIVAGLAPALVATRLAPFGLLRNGARAGDADGRALRSALVAAEVALALVLLVGAGLLARSFWRLSSVPPGFSADRVVQVPIALPAVRYATPASRLAFFDRALDRLAALPGVQQVAAVNRLPLAGGNVLVGIEIEGRPAASGDAPSLDRRVVTPGYFETMGIPLVAGRPFGAVDRVDSTERVAMINAAAATRYWPEGAIGRRLRLILRSGFGPWLTIVGVAGDVRHHGLDRAPSPEVYVPYAQAAVESMAVLVHAGGDPEALAPSIRREVQALDPELPVESVSTVGAVVDASIAQPRFRTLVVNAFAAVALTLAALGLYGIVSYSVTRRSRDIGVRIALGARRSSILAMVMREALGPTGAGAVIGLVAALLLTRTMAGLLFGVAPTDLLTFAAVTAVLVGVAAAASWLPARRATRLDPVTALRVE